MIQLILFCLLIILFYLYKVKIIKSKYDFDASKYIFSQTQYNSNYKDIIKIMKDSNLLDKNNNEMDELSNQLHKKIKSNKIQYLIKNFIKNINKRVNLNNKDLKHENKYMKELNKPEFLYDDPANPSKVELIKILKINKYPNFYIANAIIKKQTTNDLMKIKLFINKNKIINVNILGYYSIKS